MDITQSNSSMEQMEAGYSSAENLKRDQVRKTCLEKGLHWTRANVGMRTDGEESIYMAEWIDEVEHRERCVQDDRQFMLAQRGVAAAENSTKFAELSAKSASGSTRAAIASAFFAFLALIVSILAYVKT